MVSGCLIQGKETSITDKKDVTIRDLYGEMRSQRRILLVDGWEDPEYSRRLRSLASEFFRDDWQLLIKSHTEVTLEEFTTTPVMLLGTPDQNHWIDQLIQEFPFVYNENSFELSGREFNSQNHAIVLSYYPNPMNEHMPMGVFTSGNESLIWDLAQERITSLVRGNWNYEVIKDKQRVLLGDLSQNPGNRWEIDLSQQLELPGNVLEQWAHGSLVFNSYLTNIDSAMIRTIENEHSKVMMGIQGLSGKDLKDSLVNYYLYPSSELKGLMTGNTDQSHLDFDRSEVHTAFDAHFKDRYFGKENQLILQKAMGPASHEILELGLAVCFSSYWEKQGYAYWAKHLIDGGNGLTVSQLFNQQDVHQYSHLIREALAGSLVDFLMEYWGRALFLSRYANWDPETAELSQINDKWWQHVKSIEPIKSDYRKAKLSYLQGFNFTHEGYQIYNGYGSRKSRNSLSHTVDLGANAIAIVPFSWMRNPRSPSVFRFSNRAGMENDEGVIHAIHYAKKNNLFTMLKPHVWISNGWPGDVEMSSDKDWDLFFEYYYNWISHYALMAEIYQVEALCIGVEFAKATLAQDRRWRNLIEKLRKIYSGNLTYAANWGDEFENIEFWDQLDFIGLNCYYPLSNKRNASDSELEKGFSKVLEKINVVKTRFNKPVVFTEIGFRSIDSPWTQPHEEAGDHAYNEHDQAKSYAAVFKAISDNPVTDGILWWKWPTHLVQHTEQDRRFVPAGKTTERVISRWFQ